MSSAQPSIKTTEKFSLKQFQDFFDAIYAERNIERFGSAPTKGLASMWLKVVTHSGEVARGVRKRKFNLLIQELPKIFCWLCAVCSKVDIALDDAVWAWFPLICPTCYEKRCQCGGSKENDTGPEPKDRKILDRFCRENASERPRTADEYVSMFGSIYGNHSGSVDIDRIFLHFMEELGEVAELIPRLKASGGNQGQLVSIHSQLEVELADVFSWIAKLCWSANEEFQSFWTFVKNRQDIGVFGSAITGITVSALVDALYRDGCPYCRRRPCLSNCPGWTGPPSPLLSV